MTTKPAAPIPLQYSRVDMTLRRPWYVWAGAAIASLWVSSVCVAAGFGVVAAAMRHGMTEPLEKFFLVAMYVLIVLLCLMLLTLEWRAIFSYSATASATVGIVLMLPAGFAAVAEIATVVATHGHAIALPEVWYIGTVAASLGFACFTHFRWTTLIANWLTRTA